MTEVKNAGFDETTKMYEIEDLRNIDEVGAIRKKGLGAMCPIVGHMDASYVHCLTQVDHVGRETIMLSYAWAYTIGDIVDTLVLHCETEKLDPKRTYIWICCLCVNQHMIVEDNFKVSFMRG